MRPTQISADLLLQIRRDQTAIAEELPALEAKDALVAAAAAEDTLCGHLRRAIHASQRSLHDIAKDAGIGPTDLCRFLEGDHALQSDVLDRLAAAAGVVVSLSVQRL